LSTKKPTLSDSLREAVRDAMQQVFSSSSPDLSEKEALAAVVDGAEDVLDGWNERLDELSDEE
jgi:hypothetical protein